MAAFASFILLALAGLLAIPVAIFFVEVVAAVALSGRNGSLSAETGIRRRIAVLVPAHNESTGLIPTLEDIKAQLRAGDRVLVVADNCVDDTFDVAMAAGAEGIRRNDPTKIGKGYALDFGLGYLSTDPPDIVIIIDADCRLANDTLDRLTRACAINSRPVQALDLMTAPVGRSINCQVAEFAWRVKNWVRPLGLQALNLPCQLMGTGMAFPWAVIRAAELASGHIVEDVKLGLELALAGSPAAFCPSAIVISHFPTSSEGRISQRQRWEYGHIQTIITGVPRFIYLGLVQRNVGLIALAVDLAVPPLALLAILLVTTSLVAG